MKMTNFEEGPIDPRIYKQLATDMWYVTVSYLPIKDILKLPGLCKYFNEVVVWGKWSGALMWREMEPAALIYACNKCAPLTHIKCLIAGSPNINAVDVIGRTALHYASDRGHEGVVRALLKANADPNIDRWSPLICASFNNHISVAAALIESGANVNNTTSTAGWSALMLVNCGSIDLVKVLVNGKADLNLKSNAGKTALNYAQMGKNRDVTRFLEEAQLSSE